MAVTDPDNPAYQRKSMFLVPADAPGIELVRNVALGDQADREGSHAQIHGSLGVPNEMPFAARVIESFHMGLADGPSEVHKATLARLVLSETTPTEGVFPTGHLPTLRDEALARYAELLEHEVANS